jgi:hypothetical protein
VEISTYETLASGANSWVSKTHTIPHETLKNLPTDCDAARWSGNGKHSWRYCSGINNSGEVDPNLKWWKDCCKMDNGKCVSNGKDRGGENDIITTSKGNGNMNIDKPIQNKCGSYKPGWPYGR